MCGRYYIEKDDPEEILRSLNRKGLPSDTKIVGTVSPADHAAVVCLNRRLQTGVFSMQWGFVRSDGTRVINTRSERLRAADFPRRCLIPFSGYYEWEKRGKKRVCCAITPGSGFYLAGCYRNEADGAHFSVVTREAAEPIRFIHDRMPLILPGDVKDIWLNPETADLSVCMDAAVTGVKWTETAQQTLDGWLNLR